jgi:predicted PurR-regulated permease PerM
MRSLIGDSVNAQLKLLANPSETELKSFLAGAQEYLQPRVLPLTQMAGRFLFQIFIDFGILVITLYFFFADGPGMIRTLMRLSPLDDEYEERLLLQFDRTSRAVVLATVLSALTQGVLATGAFWILGMPSLVLLFLATTFMAFIPFLGPAAVWVPVAIYLSAFEGRWGAAIGLAFFGVTVVATVDNVVRMYVLKGNSQLHPLLALLSVLGGLQVFGPIGILVGPMVVVFLQTLLEILNHELSGKVNATKANASGDNVSRAEYESVTI